MTQPPGTEKNNQQRTATNQYGSDTQTNTITIKPAFKEFGYLAMEFSRSITECQDGYVAVGYMTNESSTYIRGIIVKLDNNFDTIWTNNFCRCQYSISIHK